VKTGTLVVIFEILVRAKVVFSRDKKETLSNWTIWDSSDTGLKLVNKSEESCRELLVLIGPTEIFLTDLIGAGAKGGLIFRSVNFALLGVCERKLMSGSADFIVIIIFLQP